MKSVYLIVFLAFAGVVFLNFDVGSVLQKTLISILLFAFISLHWTNRIDRDAVIILAPLFVYMFYSFLSAYYNSGSAMSSLAALQPFILLTLFFVACSVSFAQKSYHDAYKRLIVFIVVVQILFSWIKFIVVGGVQEGFLIGTMSHNAGELGFLFPAMMVPVVVFFFWRDRPAIAVFLVVLLFLFGIINHKRAIIYILPFITVVSIAINQRSILSVRSVAKLASVVIVLTFILVVGISLMPSLNSYRGFSVSYLVDYALEYLWMSYDGPLQGAYADAYTDRGIQLGRFALWAAVIDWFQASDTATRIFGVGFGGSHQAIG